MTDQLTEIRDRAIASYTQFARENPKTHKWLLLGARIAGILYSFIIKCCQRHLDHICLFLCFLLFIFAVYYVQLPVWLEIGLGLTIFFASAIGVSFLDFKERLYETTVEDKQLEDTRRLLALGVDKISGNSVSAPALPSAEVVQQYKPYQIAIGNSIQLLSRSNGIELKFSHIATTEKIDQYYYTAKEAIKGTGMIKQLNRIALQLQNSAKLRGLPTISANGTEVLISIHNEWIPPDLLAPTSSVE